ncbi:MAG: hypothetical protein KKF65_04805 [Nanoarchaeota archaeon]|nr:hypothetical protein [Nanoarchaeota archaeon]
MNESIDIGPVGNSDNIQDILSDHRGDDGLPRKMPECITFDDLQRDYKPKKTSTEKSYKTTIENWIPGYGLYKNIRASFKGESNIASDSGTLAFVHSLYHILTLTAIGYTMVKLIS